MSKALTKANNTAVAGYDDAGAGFEDIDPGDMILPFIKVAQALTPEVDEGLCRSGDLLNTVTGEVITGKDGFIFQPCHIHTQFIEWEPRAKGGAMVMKHDPHSATVADAIENNAGSDFGKLSVGDNDLVKTMYVYGLILDSDGLEPEGFAVLSFNQTKLKIVKKWITAMSMLRGKPPVYMNRARITTQQEKNDFGTFYNYKISPFDTSPMVSLLSEEDNAATIQAGREFRSMVLSGAAKAQEYEAPASKAAVADDEIPF